jgi:hypothetical protein
MATSEVLIPVTVNGATQFLPLAEDDTPSYLIVVHADKAHLLTTSDPNGDRITVGATTIAEAVGKVLMENPGLSYGDVLDHMDV